MPDTETGTTHGWTGPAPLAASGQSIVSLTTLATIVIVCAILYLAKNLFLPLALGMLFAFILTPVVNYLRRLGLRDTFAVIVTALAAATLVAAFLFVLGYQFSQIGAKLPQYQGNILTKVDTLLETGKDSRIVTHLRTVVDGISSRLEFDPDRGVSDEEVTKVQVVNSTGVTDWIINVIIPALAPVAIFGLIGVIVVFALLERTTLRDRLVQLIGGTSIVATSRLLSDAGDRVSTYLFAQLVVNVIYAVPICIGLWLIGVPNALFFGLVTLILRFIPYFGSAVSAILPLVMAFAVSPDWSLVIWTGALFLVVELTTSNIIEPWFYGQRTGLSPLAVVVSAFFWTWLWGPMGLIIATPLTVCLVVIGHHVPRLRLFSILLGDRPTLDESAQLYDRLLAGNAFAFTEAATASTAERYLGEYYDMTAIPALARAHADHQAGLLSNHQASRIALAAWQLTEELDSVAEDELTSATDQSDTERGTSLMTNGRLDGLDGRIAIMGAQTQLDDAVAAMVAQVMRAEGAQTLVLPHKSPMPRALADFSPTALVITTLDPSPGPALDRQLRQLRRRLPGVRVGVAFWPNPAATTAPGPSGNPAGDFTAKGIDDILSAVFTPAEAQPT